jgi:hypothetical protein
MGILFAFSVAIQMQYRTLKAGYSVLYTCSIGYFLEKFKLVGRGKCADILMAEEGSQEECFTRELR